MPFAQPTLPRGLPCLLVIASSRAIGATVASVSAGVSIESSTFADIDAYGNMGLDRSVEVTGATATQRRVRYGIGRNAMKALRAESPPASALNSVHVGAAEFSLAEMRRSSLQLAFAQSAKGVCHVPSHDEPVWGSILGARKTICYDGRLQLKKGEQCETACPVYYKVPSPEKIECVCSTEKSCVLEPIHDDINEQTLQLPIVICEWGGIYWAGTRIVFMLFLGIAMIYIVARDSSKAAVGKSGDAFADVAVPMEDTAAEPDASPRATPGAGLEAEAVAAASSAAASPE